MERPNLINTHQNKLHHLAQFPAAFGASFLPAREDQSHTTMAWSIAKSSLVSQTYHDVHLELEYPGLMFYLVSKDKKHTYDPLGATLSDLDHWIRETLSEIGIDPSPFSRDMGFTLSTPDDVFISLDNDDEKILLQLTEERNIAQKALSTIREKSDVNCSEIRVWPHHFDTAMLMYPEAENKNKGLSFGYSPANAISNTPYYYASAWSDKEIDYSNLPELKHGKWHLNKWKGALIPVNQALDLRVIITFYEDVVSTLKNRL